jgi:UDP-N-acetylmuramoyl-L-alanyl-D-glutamate--2,6-diaminopimelate ligase
VTTLTSPPWPTYKPSPRPSASWRPAQLASDSRRIKLGDVFFAFAAASGDAADGRNFIEGAIEQGAALIVLDPAGFSWNASWNVPYLTEQLKQQAGAIAHAYMNSPMLPCSRSA